MVKVKKRERWMCDGCSSDTSLLVMGRLVLGHWCSAATSGTCSSHRHMHSVTATGMQSPQLSSRNKTGESTACEDPRCLQ